MESPRPTRADYELPPDGDLYAGAGESDGVGEDSRSRWEAPPPPPRANPDFSALFVVLEAVRRSAPAELQERLTSLIREALLTLRSLIDWYLERLDRKPREPRVEDIPID